MKRILLWSGGISSKGVVSLIRCEKTLNSVEYIKIVNRQFLNGLYELYDGNNFFFVQDNAPCHKSHMTMDYFAKNEVHLLEIPPNSPNLNPIENIWGIMAQTVYSEGRRFRNMSELWKRVKEVWDNFTVQEVKRWIENYNERLSEVFQNLGGITKY